MLKIWLIVFSAKLTAEIIGFFANLLVSQQDWFLKLTNKISRKAVKYAMDYYDEQNKEP